MLTYNKDIISNKEQRTHFVSHYKDGYREKEEKELDLDEFTYHL
jgi:hypothetical protein